MIVLNEKTEFPVQAGTPDLREVDRSNLISALNELETGHKNWKVSKGYKGVFSGMAMNCWVVDTGTKNERYSSPSYSIMNAVEEAGFECDSATGKGASHGMRETEGAMRSHIMTGSVMQIAITQGRNGKFHVYEI